MIERLTPGVISTAGINVQNPTPAEQFLNTLNRWTAGGNASEKRDEAKIRIANAWLPNSDAKLDLSGLHLTSLPNCLKFLPSPLYLHVDELEICKGISMPSYARISCENRFEPSITTNQIRKRPHAIYLKLDERSTAECHAKIEESTLGKRNFERNNVMRTPPQFRAPIPPNSPPQLSSGSSQQSRESEILPPDKLKIRRP